MQHLRPCAIAHRHGITYAVEVQRGKVVDVLTAFRFGSRIYGHSRSPPRVEWRAASHATFNDPKRKSLDFAAEAVGAASRAPTELGIERQPHGPSSRSRLHATSFIGLACRSRLSDFYVAVAEPELLRPPNVPTRDG